MKVTVGNVTKNIPQEYHSGFTAMQPDEFDKPDKIRLTPWERYLIALHTWEFKQTSTTRRYLAEFKPECVLRQYNRKHEARYVARYVDEPDSDHARHAIVPDSLGKLCPVIMDDYVNWV